MINDTPRTLIRHPRGSQRHEVRLTDVQVPDLWHLAQRLLHDPRYGKQDSELVMQCWTLAHDLLDHARGDSEPHDAKGD